MLIDCPSELVVQLPSNEEHEQCAEAEQTRDSDEKRPGVPPEFCDRVWVVLDVFIIPSRFKVPDCLVDLLHLHSGVDQKSDVVYAQPNHLNRVLQPQGVPHKHKLVEEAKYEECEVGRDGESLVSEIGFVVFGSIQGELELCEDVTVSRSVGVPCPPEHSSIESRASQVNRMDTETETMPQA